MLAGTLVLAQFASVPTVNQLGGQAVAQELLGGMLAGSSQTPQEALFQAKSTGPEFRSALGGGLQHRKANLQSLTGPEQVIYTFQGGDDGEFPVGGLIFDASGNLYGTTTGDATSDCSGGVCGSVFKLSPNGSGGWTETTLYDFKGGSDGAMPVSPLIFDQSGNLYGTTMSGGTDGTVFKLSPTGSGGWTETILYSFKGGNSDGAQPNGGLIFDPSGNLYGTTLSGGNQGCSDDGYEYCGAVFELSPNGSGGWTETILYDFSNADGGPPPSGLILDASGNLYGTGSQGGGDICFDGEGCGVIYELSPNGSGGWTETVLHRFQGGSSDGENPNATLIFDQAGNLYGVTDAGGGTGCSNGNGCGTVFKLSPNGSGGWTETILYTFQGGSDGSYPVAPLVFDPKGNLYSTTEFGGDPTCTGNGDGCGTVFELSPNGTGGWAESVLYRFQGSTDGSNPVSGLVLDESGNLYGNAMYGGTTTCNGLPGCGVVFEVSKEPFATLSPTSLNFGSQSVNIASNPQAVTLTNSGSLPLAITSIQITGANSGDFAQNNNCPSSLSPQASCKISVIFTPLAAGNRSAAVSVTDDAPAGQQSVPLSGTAIQPGFSLTATSQSSLTVTPGQAANYAITVSAINGFANDVALSCTGAPAQSTCTVSPTTVSLSSGSARANVAVVTSGPSASLVPPAGFPPARLAMWLLTAGLPGLVLLGSFRRPIRKRQGRACCGLAMLCLLILTLPWSACGGGDTAGSGTPTGTYNLTVTGTFSSSSGNLVQSVKLTLTVQ